MNDHAARGLLPRPLDVEARPGVVELPEGSVVAADPALRAAALRWRRLAEDAFGVAWDLRGPGGGDVRFTLDPALPAGGYVLDADEHVSVAAADPAGAHAAVATLRQLLGPAAYRRAGGGAVRLPRARITDAPRCQWRGVLLDVARHFMPKAGVLRFVELVAAHKLNVLHLHLVDDQGWRMEVGAWPRLTEVGSWRPASMVGGRRDGRVDPTPHGGFYTRADLREIVAFAAAHGVTVVPEIDVPGHSQAAIAAYPKLGMADTEVGVAWGVTEAILRPTESTLAFYRDVLDEVMDVFDAPVVHLGGDEVPTGPWQGDAELARQAADLGLDGVDALHGWFVGELARHVSSRGRRAAVWDEAISPSLPSDAIVTAWRSPAKAEEAVRGGWDAVLAPHQTVYLDYRSADGAGEPVPVGYVTTVDDVYGFEPAVPVEPAPSHGRLLGGQAAVWVEHLDSGRRVDFATWPRLAAAAEALWTAPQLRDLADFRRRLTEAELPRLDAAGVEYRPEAGPHPWQQRPDVPGWPRDRAAEEPAL